MINRKPFQLKTLAFLILLCSGLSVSALSILYYTSDMRIDDREPILRVFRDDILQLNNSIKTENLQYYFAGMGNESFYFGQYSNPTHILIASHDLKSTTDRRIKITAESDLKYRVVKIAVAPPNFFIMEGVMPYIIKGSINDWIGNETVLRTNFVDALPISSTSFIIKELNPETNTYRIGKVSSLTKQPHFNSDLLIKQVDGLFCVDGKLEYNEQSRDLIYTHHYRNEIIVFDTNLIVKKRYHTIDSNRHSKIFTDSIKSENTLIRSNATKMVNRVSKAYENWLLVNSAILSKNENAAVFKESTVIDVYSILTGDYYFSFYIPNLDKQKLVDYYVFKNGLIVLYERSIASYTLATERFNASEPFKMKKNMF